MEQTTGSEHTEDYDETRAAAASVTQEYKRTLKNLGTLKGRTMTDKIDTTPEAVTLLPRPDEASTWTLDPDFVFKVSQAIQHEDGWETTMEVVQLAMLAAEKHILELFPIPALSTRIAELEDKMAKVLTIAHSAVEAVYEVQTYEQPSDPWEENALLMCELDAFDFDVDSARATLAEIKGENT